MAKRQNGFDKMRIEVLQKRYLWKDANGKLIETEDQRYHRVADITAAAELFRDATDKRIKILARKFYRLMKSKRFLPNSPTLMNAGREYGVLSACFVLPVEDSIDGIFDTVKDTAVIQKSGGGTGFTFDKLRPTGDFVASSGGTTSGPISFWKVISETTHAIQQGAHRRGANMGMMSINHPDIIKFIFAKMDTNAFTNFNISVKITDDFMKQLQGDPNKLHIVVNPRTGKKYAIPHSIDINSYTIEELIPYGQNNEDCFTVGQIWNIIIVNAHVAGEPGICFIDRINEQNPTPKIGRIDATNPCGEQPLLPYEACNLGSINLAVFVKKDGTDLCWKALRNTIRLAVRFLDNVIDVNHYPIPKIKEITLANRKIGLGIMGFADALILLGISYDSKEAVIFAEKVMAFIQDNAHQASSDLAHERGNFPNWGKSIWHTQKKPMRNAAVTTIAPTGSISIIAGCSSGIEPVFSFAYIRKALDGAEFLQIHPLIEKLGSRQGWLTGKVKQQLIEGIKPKDIPEIPQKLAEVLITSHEVAPEQHVCIQSAFQTHVDNAVSKTVNLPSEAKVVDVDKAFRLAYELGCKGITVYRDGCRENQVISKLQKETNLSSTLILPRPRSRKTEGQTTKFNMGCGKLYVTVNKDDQGLAEVFANLGKAGGCPAQSEASCRILSSALRSGVDPAVLISQLKGIRCLSTISRRKTDKNIDVLSCPDAIARALESAIGQKYQTVTSCVNKCPDCSYPLRRESGCNICDNCGYSKCG